MVKWPSLLRLPREEPTCVALVERACAPCVDDGVCDEIEARPPGYSNSAGLYEGDAVLPDFYPSPLCFSFTVRRKACTLASSLIFTTLVYIYSSMLTHRRFAFATLIDGRSGGSLCAVLTGSSVPLQRESRARRDVQLLCCGEVVGVLGVALSQLEQQAGHTNVHIVHLLEV